MTFIRKFQEIPTSCDIHLVDFGGNCSTVALVVCHSASVVELLYQAFDGVVMWDFPSWEFTMKLPLDKSD